MPTNSVVAVYGTLRKDYGNHFLLQNSKYLGVAHTEPDFNMYSLGYYPCVVKAPQGFGYSVVVELYEVDDDVMLRLDRLEGYPRHYQKTYLNVLGYDCFMYTMDVSAVESYEEICSGDWSNK